MTRAKLNTTPFIVAHYPDTPNFEFTNPTSLLPSTEPETTPEPERKQKVLQKGILSTIPPRTSSENSTRPSTPAQVKWPESLSTKPSNDPTTTAEEYMYLPIKPASAYNHPRKPKSSSTSANLASSLPKLGQGGHTVTRHWEEHILLDEKDLPTLRNLWPPPCCPTTSAASLSCKHGYRRGHARSMPETGSSLEEQQEEEEKERRNSIKELESSLEEYERVAQGTRARSRGMRRRGRGMLRRTRSEFLPLPPISNHGEEDDEEEGEEENDPEGERERDMGSRLRLRRGHRLVKAMKARVTAPVRFQRLSSAFRRLESFRGSSGSDGV